MKIIDLTPRLIGRHIRIETPTLRIEGQLRRFQPDFVRNLHERRDELIGMTVTLDRHTLELTGYEDCTIIKGQK